jgi:hypothetical protein
VLVLSNIASFIAHLKACENRPFKHGELDQSGTECHQVNKEVFTTKEPICLITSNFYSILYYNLEICQLPSLTNELKHSLFVASAAALKVCLHFLHRSVSYNDLQKLTNRATYYVICDYRMARLLCRTFKL